MCLIWRHACASVDDDDDDNECKKAKGVKHIVLFQFIVIVFVLAASRRYLPVVYLRLLTWSGLDPSMAELWRTKEAEGEINEQSHLYYIFIMYYYVHVLVNVFLINLFIYFARSDH